MRCLPVLLILFALSFSASAQKGSVEGKVTDARTGHPLTGVSVIIKSNNRGTSTDVEGRYLISNPGTGKISLVFSYNGVTQQVDEVEVKAGQPTIQDLALLQREKTEEA